MSSKKRNRRKTSPAPPQRTDPAPDRRTSLPLLASVMGLGVLIIGLGAYFWMKPSPDSIEDPVSARQFIAGADLGYVDPVACVGCHQDIDATYRLNGMGRSFYRPAPDNMVEDFRSDNSYYHKPSDRNYTMIEREDEYFIRRHQVGRDGSEINVLEKRIDYVIGSGNHSRSYLWRTADSGLAQFPISWYSEKGGYWAMSPGYDTPDHQGFLREAATDCIACHNGYPTIEEEPIWKEPHLLIRPICQKASIASVATDPAATTSRFSKEKTLHRN